MAAPTFSVSPSISPGLGTAGVTTFTATDGTVANGAVTGRRWLLNGTAIGTGTTVLPATSGNLVLENTASGAGGTVTTTSNSVNVAMASSLLALGSRVVFAGDSKVAQNSTPNMRNFPMATIERLNGRIRFALGGDQGIGGNVITDADVNPTNDLSHRLNYTTAQFADITVMAIGHNNMAGTSASVIQLVQDLHTQARTGLGAGKFILWTTVLPSQQSDGGLFPVDNVKLLAVNDAIMALNGSDNNFTKAVNLTYRSTDNGGVVFNPLTMCAAEVAGSLTQYIHPNDLGADFVGSLLAPAIDVLVTAQTYAAALADTGAAREHGANIDTKYALTGVGGTKAGAGVANISGDFADNWTISNPGSAVVVGAKIDNGDGTYRQRITISGTGLAESYIEFKATNNTSGGRVVANGVAGDVYESLLGVRGITATDGVSAPTGIKQRGLVLDIAVAGYSRGTYTGSETGLVGNIPGVVGPHITRTYPRQLTAAKTNMLPAYGIRYVGNVSIQIDLEGPITRKTDLVTYAPPLGLGSDGIKGRSEQLGRSDGAATMVNGTAYPLQYGVISGGAPTTMTYSGVRVYSGGVFSGVNLITPNGTLQATVAAGTLSYTPASVPAGDGYLAVDVTDTLGRTSTVYSSKITFS